jgi:hypothetical protein
VVYLTLLWGQINFSTKAGPLAAWSMKTKDRFILQNFLYDSHLIPSNISKLIDYKSSFSSPKLPIRFSYLKLKLKTQLLLISKPTPQAYQLVDNI